MSEAITKALRHCQDVMTYGRDAAVKASRMESIPSLFGGDQSGSSFNLFSSGLQPSATKAQYAQFRGHVYAAVNAIASRAAQQPVHVGEMIGAGEESDTKPKGKKSYLMPSSLKRRMTKAQKDLTVIDEHPMQEQLEQPNPIQSRWQFTYSFVANLCLTGWGYVLGGVNEESGEMEFYSLPSTWVRPDHTNGAFSQFFIVDPDRPASEQSKTPIPASNVAFAFLPNPANPLLAMPPSASQAIAIKIDSKIQASQDVFFDNAVFPSAIVTIGTNPHPDAAGIRPRLTPEQRKQVCAAIRKVSSGIANYGNPAIVDGMIESIERLSADQNEIGWEKSEKPIRSRILSAWGVHPFILGEEMAGSYAQATIVQDQFCNRVNTYLDMLSLVMTQFADRQYGGKDTSRGFRTKITKNKVYVWWEEAKAVDPSMEKSMWESARQREDVSQNEFRAWMDLPPDEDRQEAVIGKSNVTAVTAVAEKATTGKIMPDQAIAILEGMGIDGKVAKKIAGKGVPKPPEGQPGQPGVPGDPNAAGGAVGPDGATPAAAPAGPPPVPAAAPNPFADARSAVEDAIADFDVDEIISDILDFDVKVAESTLELIE